MFSEAKRIFGLSWVGTAPLTPLCPLSAGVLVAVCHALENTTSALSGEFVNHNNATGKATKKTQLWFICFNPAHDSFLWSHAGSGWAQEPWRASGIAMCQCQRQGNVVLAVRFPLPPCRDGSTSVIWRFPAWFPSPCCGRCGAGAAEAGAESSGLQGTATQGEFGAVFSVQDQACFLQLSQQKASRISDVLVLAGRKKVLLRSRAARFWGSTLP